MDARIPPQDSGQHQQDVLLEKPSSTTYSGPRNARGERHGQGDWSHPDGRRYVGEWRDGKRHGRGKMCYADGSFYEGGFDSGLRHGQGWLVDPNSQPVYEGEWRHGKMHGLGQMWVRTGFETATYEGDFGDGKANGAGTLTSSAGGRYEGGFKDGLKHGHGTRYAASGAVVYQGRWVRGRWAWLSAGALRWCLGWLIARAVYPMVGVAMLAAVVAALFAAPGS
jgi:hypothetical protein